MTEEELAEAEAKYISATKAAAILEISSTLLYNWRTRGAGPPYSFMKGKATSLLAYDPEEVVKWLEVDQSVEAQKLRVRRQVAADSNSMTIVQAGDYMLRKRDQLLRWRKDGKGPPFALVNHLAVFNKIEIDHWLETSTSEEAYQVRGSLRRAGRVIPEPDGRPFHGQISREREETTVERRRVLKVRAEARERRRPARA
jgi:hypothetical protein